MINVIVTIIILAALGAAVGYIVRAKKRGVKCIGCDAKGGCSHMSRATSGCGCGCGGGSQMKADKE